MARLAARGPVGAAVLKRRDGELDDGGGDDQRRVATEDGEADPVERWWEFSNVLVVTVKPALIGRYGLIASPMLAAAAR